MSRDRLDLWVKSTSKYKLKPHILKADGMRR